MSLETRLLEHLHKLVSFNTTNPPRNFDEHGLFDYLIKALPGFEHTLWNHGDGRISLLSVRGAPSILFNFHVDTVPASDAWSADPWMLRDQGDHVVGLGSCDIKGASACMLAAASATSGDVALLFSSDEEAGNSYCIKEFIRQQHPFRRVIVAEPTLGQAICAHRGIITGTVQFRGMAGHASAQQGVGNSALHQAIEWGQQALAWSASQDQIRFQNLQGVRFNIGTLNGGIKANMIAPDAELKFGLRTLPGQDQNGLLAHFDTMTRAFDRATFTPGFIAPSLDAQSQSLTDSVQLPAGPAVDFWTEAALFAAAGFEAIVFGPGSIAQAHTADEWVSKEQLISVAKHYQRIIQNGPA